MNKCAFLETYLLTDQPSSFIIIVIGLLKISNACLFHCRFYASFNFLSVQKLFRTWWRHQNVRHTTGFSYFVLNVLLRISRETTDAWFFSIVKGFRAIVWLQNLVTEALISVCFRWSTVLILLLFLRDTGRHWDFPRCMISHELLISWIRLERILNHYFICKSSGNIWILILTQSEVKWTAQKQTIARGCITFYHKT